MLAFLLALSTALASTKNNMIRPVTKTDLPVLKEIIDSTELFPSSMLDEMIGGYMGGNEEQEVWLTETSKDEENKPISLVYCGPEKLTEGTFNAWLLAVSPSHQGQGFGSRLMAHLETVLVDRGERLLLVETSGNSGFAKTRAFYEKLGYEQEARIREYYGPGEDKIIYRKSLASIEQKST